MSHMPTVRFSGEHLEDSRGRIIDIPYEILEGECLKGTYTTLSIREIVLDAVTRVTGLKCTRYKCWESSLFLRLKNAIASDERYCQKKEEEIKRQQKVKEARAEEHKNYVNLQYERDLKMRIKKASGKTSY